MGRKVTIAEAREAILAELAAPGFFHVGGSSQYPTADAAIAAARRNFKSGRRHISVSYRRKDTFAKDTEIGCWAEDALGRLWFDYTAEGSLLA